MDNSYEQYKQKLFANVQTHISKAWALNEHLAANPELSGEEFESSKKIVGMLRDEGFDVEYPFAGLPTAFKAVYGKNNHNKKMAIMLEYDALPEIGHACGHCVSGSISFLAGIAMKDLQDDLDTDIHIIGTPCEETDGAKADMVKNGVFDGYNMAMMIHMYDCNILSPVALAIDTYLYSFHGKASHASATPWDGKNAFNGVQLFFHAIDMLRQHVTDDVRMHGLVRYQGEAPNIVPELCTAEVFIRAKERTYLNEVIKMVDNCAKGAAIATGTTWEKEATSNSYDNLKVNHIAAAALAEVYQEMGQSIDDNLDDLFGSTDAGNVSMLCPTIHSTLKLVDKGISVHTKEFADGVVGERANKAIDTGAKIIGLQIIKIFSDNQKVTDMMKDFEEN